jgi:hypothetical protein
MPPVMFATPTGVMPLGVLQAFGGVPSDVRSALVNLGLALLFGQILAWHYLKFSPVLSNKRKFARVFVFIAATTMLVITGVKTSLALSLGLVGALSIIRFRTPIKEPEELAYLFLAIGVGLGLGAYDPASGGSVTDMRIITAVVFAGLLFYMALVSLRSTRGLPPRLLVHVSGDIPAGTEDTTLQALLAAVEKDVPRVDVRRVDSAGSSFEVTLVLDLANAKQIGGLMSRIRGVIPSGSVSVVEGGSLE